MKWVTSYQQISFTMVSFLDFLCDAEERRHSMPMKKTELVTVYDLAKSAGVSVATVSRVLNGYPNVSDKTRERITRLIERSGFRPNAHARRLAHGHSGQICFLLSNRQVVHSFHSRILMGVEDHCRQQGQHVVFATFDYGPEDSFPNDSVPPLIGEHGSTEGVLLAGVNYPNFLHYLGSLGLPYVIFGNNLVAGSEKMSRKSHVLFDEHGGGEKAASFLAELGHRDLLFVGDLSKPWYRRRFEGYQAAVTARGLTPAVLDLQGSSDAFQLGQQAAAILIQRHPKTSAVLAQDDDTACGLLDALRRVGVRVPEDLSVMGYDDITEIRYMSPSLTTIRVPKEDIGGAMAVLLLSNRGATDARSPLINLPTEVIIRDSCRKRPHT